MSRAFVNEDKAVEDLPDRPVSTHPNYVTVKGLALIDSALENFRRQHAEAQASGDRAALAKAGRELRYWSVRRASAQLVEARPSVDTAQFGSTVTIVRDDGRKETFQIVREDEPILHRERSLTCRPWLNVSEPSVNSKNVDGGEGALQHKQAWLSLHPADYAPEG